MSKGNQELVVKRASNGFVITTFTDDVFDAPISVHTTADDLIASVRAWACPPAPPALPRPKRPARKLPTR